MSFLACPGRIPNTGYTTRQIRELIAALRFDVAPLLGDAMGSLLSKRRMPMPFLADREALSSSSI
jgi:hypothetical protein